MKIEIQIPDDVIKENQDILDAVKPENISKFHECCYEIGLLIARRSGSMVKFHENFVCLTNNLPMDFPPIKP